MPAWNSDRSASGKPLQGGHGVVADAARGARLRRASGSAAARRVEQARPYLEAGDTLPVVTGILNVWQHDPADVAARPRQAHARASRTASCSASAIGHPEATSDYTRPLKTMREFFDGLDAAETPVPKDQRVAAALGPKMLDLAAERSLGTHPYFIDARAHPFARERLGPDALVAPEVAVVVEADPETARRLAREYAKLYLGLTNYTNNLLKFGYTEQRHRRRRLGPPDRRRDPARLRRSEIAEAIRAHLEAGADHVCLQPLGHGPEPRRGLPRAGEGAALANQRSSASSS